MFKRVNQKKVPGDQCIWRDNIFCIICDVGKDTCHTCDIFFEPDCWPAD